MQGSNNQLKKRLLKIKIKMEKPTIIFLQETKCSGEELRNYIKFFRKAVEVMEIDANGAVEGLGILWNPNLVSLNNFVALRNMLLGRFHVLGTMVRGVITNVYGPFQLVRNTTFLEELSSRPGPLVDGRRLQHHQILRREKGGNKGIKWNQLRI